MFNSKKILKKILYFGLLLWFHSLYSQDLNVKIAQLKSELHENPDDKKRASLYSDLTWYYASVSIDSALYYGKKAISESEKLNDINLLSQVYSDLGAVHFRNNDFKNAEKNYLKSYEIRKEQKNVAGIAKLNNNLASVYRNLFQYKKAMAMYLEGLKYFESTSDYKNINTTKANIGLLFMDLKDYNNATKYLQEAIDYFEKQEKSIEIKNKLCENYLNLGKVAHQTKDYTRAEKYYAKSAEICSEIGNKQGFAYSKRNIGNIQNILKKDSLAMVNIEISEKARKELNSKIDLESNNVDFAQNLINQKKFSEAKKILLGVLPTFEKEDAKEDALSTYKLLTQIYHQTHQSDSAEIYFQKYIEFDNILVNTSVNKDASEMEKKYQSLKKDKEILAQKSKIFKRNVVLFSLLGLLLLGFIYYKNYQNKQKVKLQKAILHQQDLATKAVMNAEDNERKRMATHLHDGIGQLLSAVNMNVSVLDDYKEDENAFTKVLNKTKNILDEAIADVRTLSHQIMPNMLIKNSLSKALRDLIEKTTSPKLHISLKMEGLDDDIDQNIQVVLYRIIQECINNTIKHSEAKTVNVSILQKGNSIKTEITDDGIGFNPLKVSSKSDGMGLENIKSRIKFLKGNIDIKSAKGEGTSVIVEIPLV